MYISYKILPYISELNTKLLNITLNLRSLLIYSRLITISYTLSPIPSISLDRSLVQI